MLIANKPSLGLIMMAAQERETEKREIVKERSENGEGTLHRQKWHEKGSLERRRR